MLFFTVSAIFIFLISSKDEIFLLVSSWPFQTPASPQIRKIVSIHKRGREEETALKKNAVSTFLR